MANKKWIYTGVFLDEASKRNLMSKFPIPDGWNAVFDHMTVIYNDGTTYVKHVKSIIDKMIGKKFKLKIVAQGISDRAYAVKVQVPVGLPTAQHMTHITLAVSPAGKPVDSNYIDNWNDIYGNMYVTGVLKHFEVDE